MNSKTILNRTELQWEEISKHVMDALVLMDDASAECLHWHGGLNRILNAGALSVENFSPFVKAELGMKKVVFILMFPLTGEVWRTLMMAIRANSFKQCIVITSLPSRFHNTSVNEAEQSFIVLENYMLSWMEGKNNSASIYHIPLFATHISSNMFILPSFAKKFSIFNCGLLEMNRKKTEELTLKNLSSEMEASFKHLAYSLNSLLDTFQVKGDFFSLGPLSYLLASELENLSQQQKRKSSHSNKSSVVIIDRILDLAGPLCQSYETMLDKILLTLPHLPGHTFDVCVNMEDLSASKSDTVFGRPLLAPGCISHKSNSFEEVCLNSILCKKPREVLIDINRNLVDCAGKEGISVDVSSRLTPDVLKKKVISFKEKPKSLIKFSGLLQQSLAVIQALEISSASNVDNLSAIEKALLQYLTTSGEEVLSNIMTMIAEKDEMNYKIEEIIIFLAFFYLLSGETDLQNESSMQATLMEVLFQEEEISELLSLFVNEEAKDDENVLNAVRTFFCVLKRMGSMRKRMKRYFALFKSVNPAFPASYNPLLKQLLDDIFDSTLQDIPDIEFHSAGIKDYIKTGFSLFMNVAKPQPRDNSLIFLIVIGGITPLELKMVQEYAASNKDKEIILCCTEVLTPSDVLKDIGMIVKNLCAQTCDTEDV